MLMLVTATVLKKLLDMPCIKFVIFICLQLVHIVGFALGIPVWIGRKLYSRYKLSNKHKRNAAIVGGVVASVSTFLLKNQKIFF